MTRQHRSGATLRSQQKPDGLMSPRVPTRRPTSSRVIVREVRSTYAFTYGRTDAPTDDDFLFVSAPGAIDFAFTANPNAVVLRPNGRIERHAVTAGFGGSVGEPLIWLDAPAPSEFVEVRVSRSERLAVAEDLKRPDLADLGERYGEAEPWLFMLASRVRAHALGGRAIGDLEGEALVQLVLRRTIVALGGRETRRTDRGLDTKRLKRVVDFIDANLHRPLRGAELADVAAVSRFHFARMFTLAVGAPPHGYVTARRLERARSLLAIGRSLAEVASESGYAPSHQFRRLVRAAFGPTR